MRIYLELQLRKSGMGESEPTEFGPIFGPVHNVGIDHGNEISAVYTNLDINEDYRKVFITLFIDNNGQTQYDGKTYNNIVISDEENLLVNNKNWKERLK